MISLREVTRRKDRRPIRKWQELGTKPIPQQESATRHGGKPSKTELVLHTVHSGEKPELVPWSTVEKSLANQCRGEGYITRMLQFWAVHGSVGQKQCYTGEVWVRAHWCGAVCCAVCCALVRFEWERKKRGRQWKSLRRWKPGTWRASQWWGGWPWSPWKNVLHMRRLGKLQCMLLIQSVRINISHFWFSLRRMCDRNTSFFSTFRHWPCCQHHICRRFAHFLWDTTRSGGCYIYWERYIDPFKMIFWIYLQFLELLEQDNIGDI